MTKPVLLLAATVAMLIPTTLPAVPTPWGKSLSGEGLRIGPAGKLMPFGTPRAGALRQLAEAFGKPVRQRTIADCGQGQPMGEATYRGALTITFLKGKFSGWTVDRSGRIRTDRDVSIGSTRAAVRRAYPGMSVDDGSLGVMFATEEGVGGFLDADTAKGRVVGLYAGETCMVS